LPRFWPLGQHDLSGKTAIPFITHGGYGLGNSISVLRTHAPWARYVEGFSMLAPQERQTIAPVTDWLSGLGVSIDLAAVRKGCQR
jgi:hypothetical protein